MKTIKKAITILLASIFILSSFCLLAGAESVNTTAKPLSFNSDGKFKIMHVTDTHLSDENSRDTLALIALACDLEKPDLIILGGDNAAADTLEETKALIKPLMELFDSRNIPTAVTFGNHDSERGTYTREEVMEYYNTFSCSVSIDDGDVMTGCGTYNIPLLASDKETTAFNIWVFDSGDYDEEGHYANVSEDQVQWYKEKSAELERANGKKINSLAFQHIIVPEIYDALEEVKIRLPYSYKKIYESDKYYRFDPSNKNYGTLHETPCSGYYNHGQFEAMVERGDILAMFTGHDHTNAFGVQWKGIDIVNSLSTRYQGDAFSTQYGYRIVELDENDTSTYKTRVVHWYDFVNDATVKSLASDKSETKLLSEIRFKGFFQKLFRTLGVFFSEILTGRKVSYPD